MKDFLLHLHLQLYVCRLLVSELEFWIVSAEIFYKLERFAHGNLLFGTPTQLLPQRPHRTDLSPKSHPFYQHNFRDRMELRSHSRPNLLADSLPALIQPV